MTSRTRPTSELLSALLSLVRGIDRVHSSGALVRRSGVRIERGLHPVLMTIERQEPVRTTDLATSLALGRSTVSRHAARLEQLGLVERAGDPGDARATLLRISPHGREVLVRLHEAWDAIIAEQLALVHCEDPERLAREIQILVDALELIPIRGSSSR